MIVNEIKLNSYRNYADAAVRLSQGVNVFVGANAQGKTNLAEAVVLACIGRSPRTPRDKELIRWESDGAYVRVEGMRSYGRVTVEVALSRTENKRVRINGLPVLRIGELMSNLNCVFFSPDELRIVKAGPADRRRFLDIDISQLSKSYFYELSRYNRVLYQRNKLLKSGQATTDTLSIWDVQLAKSGAKIAYQRKQFVKRLASYGAKCHSYLTDGAERLEVGYEGTEGETVEELERNLAAALERSLERDLKFGFTSAGPHKDDVALTVGGADMRAYGSQGQQRTVALSLKLAELEIFANVIGEYPVLILDDVLSELDLDRQEKLFGKLKDVQTLITCTHLERDLPGAKRFLVENGTVREG